LILLDLLDLAVGSKVGAVMDQGEGLMWGGADVARADRWAGDFSARGGDEGVVAGLAVEEGGEWRYVGGDGLERLVCSRFVGESSGERRPSGSTPSCAGSLEADRLIEVTLVWCMVRRYDLYISFLWEALVLVADSLHCGQECLFPSDKYIPGYYI